MDARETCSVRPKNAPPGETCCKKTFPEMLLIEDETVLGDALKDWFEALGFEVARAKSLACARNRFASARFDATETSVPDG